MSNKIDSIIKEVLERVDPAGEDLKYIDKSLKDFLRKINSQIKKNRLKVEVFVGGSFAKKTVIRKEKYDVDVFLRFDKKYNEKVSQLTKKLLKNVKGVSLIHGSRDYFKIKLDKGFEIELIPVVKVNNPDEAENITDLSYSHVKYINGKAKSKKTLDEIKILKAFCYANGTYGAESYVKGFSGYALELLIVHYGNFTKLLKEISKSKGKIVIDMEKQYKNKAQVLMDLNSSKLDSPIVVVDPTSKNRNALAALSDETFEKFRKSALKFLKSPSIRAFDLEKVDLEKVEKGAKKKGLDFVLIELETKRQEGDIAGTKLLKFYNHLEQQISKSFDVKNRGFDYFGGKEAQCFFVAKPKKEIISNGPFIKDHKNLKLFKKKHKKTFTKNGKIYSREKVKGNLKDFIKKWEVKYNKRLKEMQVDKMNLI